MEARAPNKAVWAARHRSHSARQAAHEATCPSRAAASIPGSAPSSRSNRRALAQRQRSPWRSPFGVFRIGPYPFRTPDVSRVHSLRDKIVLLEYQPGAMQAHLRRGDRTFNDLGDLFDRQVMIVAQDQDLPMVD